MRGVPALCLLLLAACSTPRRSALDPELAACVPASATAIAGIDAARLRHSALADKLPFPEVQYALAITDGKDWLIVARGQIQGATAIAPGISAIGSDSLLHAATAQHRTGKTGSPFLIEKASAAPLWLAARGDASLPVTGNIGNINRLLRQTEYVTLQAEIADRAQIQGAGFCRSPEQAKHLEENIRAIASLLLAKFPVEVRSEGAVVRVSASLPLSLLTLETPPRGR